MAYTHQPTSALASGHGHKIPRPTKFAVQVEVSAPSFEAHRYQNYASYQAQQENVPPIYPALDQQYSSDVKENGQALRNDTSGSTAIAQATSKSESADGRAVDYSGLLLSLAEEYLDAARALGPDVASQGREEDLERYHKLLATGLGCLESTLQRWRLHPETEARVRLRYAGVLYDETENMMEAETTLSKGISLCERVQILLPAIGVGINASSQNRFIDLKYMMQRLLARVMYKRNRKAAMKLLDSIVEDVEAYQRIPWVYEFRFLRVSLCLEMSASKAFTHALNNLRSISNLARSRRDNAILLVSAVTEALVHLLSNNNEPYEQAQRAIATARSLQLTDSISELPQLVVLLHVLDLLCSLIEPNPQEAAPKMQGLLPLLEQTARDLRWSPDGTFSVRIESRHQPDQRTKDNGPERITFAWLSSLDVCMLGYFLCAVTTSHINSPDPHPAERYFHRALRMAESNIQGSVHPEHLSSACSRLLWRTTLAGYIRVHLALFLCRRAQWIPAGKLLEKLRDDGSVFESRGIEPLATLIQYLTGVIYQGTGSSNAALSVFRKPAFDTTSSFCTDPTNSSQRVQRDLAVLAALNTVLIIRSHSDLEDLGLESLISDVETLCTSSPNRNIHSALNFIKASSLEGDSMIKTKKYLEQALTAARSLGNTQLICMTLAFLSWKFFRGVIGDQAEKGAKAAVHTARKSNNDLWISVCSGMFADTLEVQGKSSEARAIREEAQRLAESAMPLV